MVNVLQGYKKAVIGVLLISLLLISMFLGGNNVGAEGTDNAVSENGSIGLTVSPSAFSIKDKVMQGTDSEEKSTKVVVKNVGNEVETFKITPTGYLLVKPDNFVLKPNETKEVEVFLKVPATAKAEERNDTFRIFAEGEVTKAYNAELEVKVNYTVGEITFWVKVLDFLSNYWMYLLLAIIVLIVLVAVIRRKKKDEDEDSDTEQVDEVVKPTDVVLENK